MSGFDFWAACKAAIAIDSTSEHGNAEYVEFLKKILGNFDLAVRTQEVDGSGYRGLNLIGEKGGGPDVILFDTHLDTVSPGDRSLWTETGGDPFCATIRDGKIFGLGAADVKLDFLCKLKALEKYVGRRFRNRFILLGTFGEEVGLIGAQVFLEEYQGQLDFALIGEPTSLKLVNRHKGRGCYEFRIREETAADFPETLTLEFQGEAAHSSTPEKGKNALGIAMTFLAGLHSPPTHLSIRGGKLLNIVPESCSVTVPASSEIQKTAEGQSKERGAVRIRRTAGPARLLSSKNVFQFWSAASNVRSVLPKDTTWVWATASTTDREFVFEFDSRFWEDAESITNSALENLRPAVCRVIRKNASFFETSTAWHVEGICGALEEVGVKPEFETKTASTEAALFGQRCTSLVFGPGLSEGNVHRPNEFNWVSELETAIRAYDAILRRLVAVPS